jgi:hypothetical protein
MIYGRSHKIPVQNHVYKYISQVKNCLNKNKYGFSEIMYICFFLQLYNFDSFFNFQQEMFMKHLRPPLDRHYRVHKPFGHEWKLQITGIFSKSKGHYSIKNGSIIPKTKLELDILPINLYTKFHFNICNHCKENEPKLQIIGIF